VERERKGGGNNIKRPKRAKAPGFQSPLLPFCEICGEISKKSKKKGFNFT